MGMINSAAGTVSPNMTIPKKKKLRPGKWRRAKAYPASESKQTESVVMDRVTTMLLNSQRGTGELEPKALTQLFSVRWSGSQLMSGKPRMVRNELRTA